MNKFEIIFGIVAIINSIIYFVLRFKNKISLEIDNAEICMFLGGILTLFCGIYGGK